MMKRALTVVCFLGLFAQINAQDVKHYTKFEEFKPMLENAQGDTL